jgi:hypothetical protein
MGAPNRIAIAAPRAQDQPFTIVETAPRQWYIKPWQMVRLSS